MDVIGTKNDLVSTKIEIDTKDDPSVDMLMTHRGELIFAWSSADEVVHVYDTRTMAQRSRLVNVEEEWDLEHLDAIADMYHREGLDQ